MLSNRFLFLLALFFLPNRLLMRWPVRSSNACLGFMLVASALLTPFGCGRREPTSEKEVRIEDKAGAGSTYEKPVPSHNPIDIRGDWRGVCAQPDLQPYTMIMQIMQQEGDTFAGVVIWPAFNNSSTRFTGSMNGSKVRFVENELIAGDVAIPVIYEGEFIGNTLSGTCSYTNIKGTFSLSKSKSPNQK